MPAFSEGLIQYQQFGFGNPGNSINGVGGGTVYPLTTSTTNSLLQDADVPLYWLLQFFNGVLQIHAQGRWATQTALMGAKFNAQYPNIVGSYYPFNPFPFLQDTTIQFPLLAVYRVEGKIFDKTVAFQRIESQLEIAYVLPPLTLSQTERIGQFLNVVLDVLSDRNEYGFDPQFMDGYNVGLAAGYDAVGMESYANMMIPHTQTNLPMQAVVMKMMMRERTLPVPTLIPTITAIDTSMNLVNADGYATIPNFLDFNNT